MSGVILHHYNESPFTQKALRMLGIKGLAWQSVTTPMMPPKDDLVALTGGYRGTPVMQIGADIYVDSQRIAMELEQRFPEPTLFPGDAALHYMVVRWADAFFRAGLVISINLLVSKWPAAFLADRMHLFPDLDWDGARRDASHACSQFRSHARLLEQQLSDGRRFLLGERPGLADAQTQPFVWMARGYFPDVAERLFAGFSRLNAWHERVAALGEGQRVDSSATEAFAAARAGRSPTVERIDPTDPLALPAGARVEIAPDDTQRGEVRGALLVLDAREVAIKRRDDRCGEVVVHFPRLGYRVTPLDVG